MALRRPRHIFFRIFPELANIVENYHSTREGVRTHFCNAKDNIDERCTKLNACTDYASSWRDIYPDSKKYFALIYASLKLDKGAANLKKFSKKLNPKNIGKKVTRKFKPGAFVPAHKKREKAILKNMLIMYEEKKKRGDIFIKESKIYS